MKNDIVPQKKIASEEPQNVPSHPSVEASHDNPEPPAAAQSTPPSKSSNTWRIVSIVIGILLLIGLGGVAWYGQLLRPVAAADVSRTRLRVPPASSVSDIASLLKQNGLIRSEAAFTLYARLSGTQAKMQAGTYSLSPSESVAEITNHLTSGKSDEFTLTFYPGATLRDHTDRPKSKKVDVETILLRAGYDQAEVDAALSASYDSPLFATKPKTAGLEGYVYGETYNYSSSASAQEVLEKTFDQFATVVEQKNLVARYKRQGLTLYEGITLASIIQREVPDAKDQRQVAQVFLLRLKKDMPLGSDITAYYGADQLGVERAVSVDTPYNTRIHKGLPPGPIAAPGETALEAVANPASGDYLYFLSGDDEITYFARTDAEHEANIRNHCEIKCAMQ